MKHRLFSASLLLTSYSLLLAPMVNAQGITNPVLPQMGKGDGAVILGNLIGGLVGLFLIFGAIGAFVYLLLGALRWITSGGDKQQLEQARDAMSNAIVGLIILAAIFALVTMVYNFLGLGTSDAGGIQLPLPTLFQGNTGTSGNPAFSNTFQLP